MPAIDPADLFPLHGVLSVVGLLIYVVGSHALHQRRHPSAAIGWVLMILLLPEVGLPLYLLFGTRKLPKAQARREVAPIPADASGAPDWAVPLTASMGLAPALAYDDLAIHEDGAQARESLFSMIDGARERLDVCTFILGRDDFGGEVARRLGARARDGVKVRLIVDGVGALMGGRSDFSDLEAQGAKVALFVPPLRSPFKWPIRGRTNLRNHRKMVVADRARLWSGGRNLAGEYFEGAPGRDPWVDLSFELSGPLAREAAVLFEADWAFARSGRSARVAPPRGLEPEDLRAPAAQLIPTGPDYADDTVHTLLLTAFYRARSRIVVVTPYLVPDASLLAALTLAARRGVRVDIAVPRRSNHKLADIARNRPVRELLSAGAQVWLAPEMLHAKLVVVDEDLALCGSVNVDSRSLFLNYELMTAFYERSAVARYARWGRRIVDGADGFVAPPETLARSIGEGLVLWLAFQL